MGSAIKQGWGMFAKNIKLAAALAGLYMVIGLALLPFQMKMQEFVAVEGEFPEIPGGFLAGAIVIYVVLFFLNVFIQGGILGAARNYVKAGSAAIGDFVSSGKKFYLKLLGFTVILALVAAICWGIIFLLGFLVSLPAKNNVDVQNTIFVIFAILGGLISFVVLLGFIFAPFAIVARELGPIAALKHSWQLAKSHIGTVVLLAVFLVVVGLVGAGLAMLVRLPFGEPSGVVMAGLTIFGNILATILGLWVVGTVTAVYDQVSSV